MVPATHHYRPKQGILRHANWLVECVWHMHRSVHGTHYSLKKRTPSLTIFSFPPLFNWCFLSSFTRSLSVRDSWSNWLIINVYLSAWQVPCHSGSLGMPYHHLNGRIIWFWVWSYGWSLKLVITWIKNRTIDDFRWMISIWCAPCSRKFDQSLQKSYHLLKFIKLLYPLHRP